MTKIRLDTLVQSQNQHLSKSAVQSLIMQGMVTIEGKVVSKSGFFVDELSNIELKNNELPYVSRGGLKLQKVFDENLLDVTNAICADIGASTGGFTDCLLQHGAQKVYAIDVGHGQLAEKLRNDTRVVVMEKTHIQNVLTLPDRVNVITIDVSFISLRNVLPHAKSLLHPDGKIIALFKPQFEADKITVSKGKGVIRDLATRQRLIDEFSIWVHQFFIVISHFPSPIFGPKGNLEELFMLTQKPLEETT